MKSENYTKIYQELMSVCTADEAVRIINSVIDDVIDNERDDAYDDGFRNGWDQAVASNKY